MCAISRHQSFNVLVFSIIINQQPLVLYYEAKIGGQVQSYFYFEGATPPPPKKKREEEREREREGEKLVDTYLVRKSHREFGHFGTYKP